MTCPHFINDTCDISSQIAGVPCRTTAEICTACINSPRPKRLNRYTAELAFVYNKHLDQRYLSEVIDGTSVGFGTRLSNTLGIFFKETPDCPCPGRKDILDVWTPEYIRDNLEQVVKWLEQEAHARRLPFFRSLARTLLLLLLKDNSDTTSPEQS